MSKLVVLVEDDKDTLFVMSVALSDAGFSVDECPNIERLEEAIAKRPSIILMDVRLPDANGDSLRFKLKSNPSTSHIPIILVSTAFHLQEMAEKCKADAFLTKPFNVEDLIAMVRQYSTQGDFEREFG